MFNNKYSVEVKNQKKPKSKDASTFFAKIGVSAQGLKNVLLGSFTHVVIILALRVLNSWIVVYIQFNVLLPGKVPPVKSVQIM